LAVAAVAASVMVQAAAAQAPVDMTAPPLLWPPKIWLPLDDVAPTAAAFVSCAKSTSEFDEQRGVKPVLTKSVVELATAVAVPAEQTVVAIEADEATPRHSAIISFFIWSTFLNE